MSTAAPPAWQSPFVLTTIVVSLGIMAFEIAPIDLTLLFLTFIYVPTGIIKISEATAGFSSEGLVTVMVLYPVALAIAESGALDFLQKFFTLGFKKRANAGLKNSESAIIYRIAVPMIFLSAFYNNTPQVAMFIPIMQTVARELNIAPSKLMLPLSYSSIFGGCLALIGTSTNLLAYSLAVKSRPDEIKGFGQFTIATVGGPVALVSLLYLGLLGPYILPNRQGTSVVVHNPREYVILATVGKLLNGKTIRSARLNKIEGVSLVNLDRGSSISAAPSPDTQLSEGDVLWFGGELRYLLSLQNIKGLVVNSEEPVDLDRLGIHNNIYESVVAVNSELIGKTVKEAAVRENYKGAVVAVHREGQRVEESLETLRFRANDILLILAPNTFLDQHSAGPHYHNVFSVVRPAVRSLKGGHKLWKQLVTIIPFITAVVLSSLEVSWALSLAAGGVFSVFLILISRIITPEETRRSLDWEVFIAVGTSLGLGTAMTNSGAAQFVAKGLVDASANTGEAGLLIVVYVLTVILNAIVSNNASVALSYPIIDAALKLRKYSLWPFLLVLMMAGSADFSTPIGYQTNMMVLAPGGYRFYDYVLFGLPLQFISGVFTILATVTREYWYIWVLVLTIVNGIVWASVEGALPILDRLRGKTVRSTEQPDSEDDVESGEVVRKETITKEDEAAPPASQELLSK
ncbi:hypothetical protein BJ742DRAFT_851023 [Cladochytrium replicatum]|nr:hypothetical protein BJ742DRAFT_851023 [Cladochytrium replicatum]